VSEEHGDVVEESELHVKLRAAHARIVKRKHLDAIDLWKLEVYPFLKSLLEEKDANDEVIEENFSMILEELQIGEGENTFILDTLGLLDRATTLINAILVEAGYFRVMENGQAAPTEALPRNVGDALQLFTAEYLAWQGRAQAVQDRIEAALNDDDDGDDDEPEGDEPEDGEGDHVE